jgi:hypothetical protein
MRSYQARFGSGVAAANCVEGATAVAGLGAGAGAGVAATATGAVTGATIGAVTGAVWAIGPFWAALSSAIVAFSSSIWRCRSCTDCACAAPPDSAIHPASAIRT